MRSKPIWITLTLAAALLGILPEPSRAQVYSINIVGYYNVTVVPGWNLLANQLRLTNMNANYVLIPSSPVADGSLLYRFNPTNQNYYDAAIYYTNSGVGWYAPSGEPDDPSLELPLGEGFFISSRTTWNATFVGEVVQGSLDTPLPARYSLKASMIPQQGTLTGDLAFPEIDGADVHFFLRPNQRYTDAFTFFAGAGWADATGGVIAGGPTNFVGESFFLHNPGPATVWHRNFTVQFAGTGQPGEGTGGLASSKISQIRLSAGMVRLSVLKANGATYAVQFSRDRMNWTTVAANQSATLWEEPVRPGAQGYYQVVNP